MPAFNEQNFINKLNNYDFQIYKKQINHFFKFVTDPLWKNTLSFDMALNYELAEDIYNYISEVENNKRSLNAIDKIMSEILEKCKLYLKKAESIDEPILAWLTARHAYAYYGLNEIINEGSIFTNYVLSELKNEYGDNYLDILKKIDNSNPSALTKITQKNALVKESFASKIYLLMKKWQDEQHSFHNNFLFPKFVKFRDNYKAFTGEQKNTYYSVGMYILNNTPILPINVVSRFVLAGRNEQLTDILGGKNLGLAILNSIGAKIPETYCISVNSLEQKLYINYLNDIKLETFSVRSSATVEDGKKNSFAGMFKSCLNVNKKNLIEAIDVVYKSLTEDRVIKYVEHFKTVKPKMSVVLQNFKEPEISGVWLGKEMLNGHLEWTNGNGEKLVSGKTTPKYEKWDKNQNNDNPLSVSGLPVGVNCIKLQEELNTVADFEWCILNGELVWLQFRAVTVKFEANLIENINSSDIVGSNASSGTAKQFAYYYESPEDCNDFKEGSILLADFTDPDWLPTMLKSSAIITAEGGFLSHAAIISRELGIPCVTGIGYDNLEKLDKCFIEVNGTTGIIKILNNNEK